MVPADDGALTELGMSLWRFVTAPVRPQTYRNLLYLLLAFPLGIIYISVVPGGFVAGLALSLFLVGLPILALLVGFMFVAAGLERRLARALLQRPVSGRSTIAGDGWRDTLKNLVTDPKTWAPLVYLPLKFAVGTAALLVATTGLSTGVSMLFVPLYYDQPGLYVGLVTDRPVELHPALYVGWNNLLVGFETVLSVGYWEIESLPAALMVAVAGLTVCLLTVAVLNGLARATGWLTGMLLADGYDPFSGFSESSEHR
jgi:hypothetical protein